MRVSNFAWFFLLCVLLGVSALGYVWQKNQINQLAAQKRGLEGNLRTLRDQNQTSQLDLTDLQTVAKIEAKIKEMNLGLGYPQPEQVIRLVDSPWTGASRAGAPVHR